MTDLTALRNHYKAEVRAKLEMKVAKQRKEREEKKNELEKVAQEEMEKKVCREFFVNKFTNQT